MSPVVDGVVTREITVDAPPETVFSFFTDPERMTSWMGTEAELDPRPGGALAVLVAGRNPARGEFVEVDPPHRVVFTWGWESPDWSIAPGGSTVEVTLTAEEGGTRVVLVHRDLPSEDSASGHDAGWDHYLARLAVAGAGGDAGPDTGPGGTN